MNARDVPPPMALLEVTLDPIELRKALAIGDSKYAWSILEGLAREYMKHAPRSPALSVEVASSEVAKTAHVSLMDSMETAWGIIANAYGGDWEKAPDNWRAAAERWRDEHWHPALARAPKEQSGEVESVLDAPATELTHVEFQARARLAGFSEDLNRFHDRLTTVEHRTLRLADPGAPPECPEDALFVAYVPGRWDSDAGEWFTQLRINGTAWVAVRWRHGPGVSNKTPVEGTAEAALKYLESRVPPHVYLPLERAVRGSGQG